MPGPSNSDFHIRALTCKLSAAPHIVTDLYCWLHSTSHIAITVWSLNKLSKVHLFQIWSREYLNGQLTEKHLGDEGEYENIAQAPLA